MCITADSLHYTAETNTAFLSNYTPIKKYILKKNKNSNNKNSLLFTDYIFKFLKISVR